MRLFRTWKACRWSGTCEDQDSWDVGELGEQSIVPDSSLRLEYVAQNLLIQVSRVITLARLGACRREGRY